MNTLYTIGYNVWPASKRIEGMTRALTQAPVSLLVDIRHSPCPSDPTGRSSYGPKPWTLQRGEGILSHLKSVGVRYAWLPELGNPQKTDRQMAILRWHLTDRDQSWPVHRGLELLEGLMNGGEVCCLLCACDKYEQCHRRLIAEAWMARRAGDPCAIFNLGPSGPVFTSSGASL
jgi:uncharacterized protein (DUF488 family)